MGGTVSPKPEAGAFVDSEAKHKGIVTAFEDSKHTGQSNEDVEKQQPQAASSSDVTFQQIEGANTALTDLEASHAGLVESLNDGSFDMRMLRDALEAGTSNLQALRRFLDSSSHKVLNEERASVASAAKAKQVFGTAELFEQIVLYLEPRDALSAVQITKTALCLCDDSKKIQNKLSLRCADDGFIYSSFMAIDSDDEESASFANFEVLYETIPPPKSRRVNPSATPKKRTNRVTIEAHFSQFGFLPKISTRCRTMLICQPPVKVMQVTPNCCRDARYDQDQSDQPTRWASGCSRPNSEEMYGEDEEHLYLDDDSIAQNDVLTTLEIKNKTGITVGDIHDATDKLSKAHALCPHAAAELHDERGLVCPDVRFHSDMTLKNDDPLVIAEAKADADEKLKAIADDAKSRAFDVYVRMKQVYWQNGWAIPTYKEFKKKHL